MRRKATFLALLAMVWTSGGVSAQDKPEYALKGTLVTMVTPPPNVFPDGTIVVSGARIEAVGPAANLGQTKLIETDSFIFPGLIDLHNHLTWNLFPRWQPNVRFSNRYEWQQREDYKAALDTPHRLLFEENWRCEANLFGEVKALVGGATSSVGSLAPSAKGLSDNKCIEGLVRNLDFYSGLYQPGVFNAEKLRYEVFPMEVPFDDADAIRKDLASGQLKAFLIHLSEGKPGEDKKPGDASALREYRMIKAQGFFTPGVSFIHAVPLQTAQFREMAGHGVGLIWSPRSNYELYGGTTDVASAKRAGVTMALSPDWSPSGSDGMIQELKYAAEWNAKQNPKVFDDEELVKMATVYPAQLAGLSDKIGILARGRFADLLLIRRNGKDPYKTLVAAGPADIRLVVVGGEAVYGDSDLMEKLVPAGQLEVLPSICGKTKMLNQGSSPFKKWAQAVDDLSSALKEWKIRLSDLTECRN